VALLEIENLHVHYGKAEAIKGVSLHVEQGEVVSIVGANGAGKTTLLRTISGLKKATSGEIRFDGKRITGMAAHEIVKLGIAHIPAGRMLFAPMTVLDNLQCGAHLRTNQAEINQDLENVYQHFPILQERQNQIAGSLSGGQQQMLAVARGLMTSPRLLIMDEPSVGISPILVAEISKIIQDINRKGISILLVEQNARMALKLGNRAYVLQTGSFVLEGPCCELSNNEGVKCAYLGGVA
jgi:branched-chain amino acid transport system ATP-binding protein